MSELKIAPSEAWRLDFVELYYLFDLKTKKEIDTSIMLNFERIMNGASTEWLNEGIT